MRQRPLTESAATAVAERYAERLRRLVRVRISRRLARRLDASDVVMSALRSYLLAARSSQTAPGDDAERWPLLAQIALRKLYRQAAYHGAQKRSMTRDVSLEDASTSCVAHDTADPKRSCELRDQWGLAQRRLPALGQRILQLKAQGEGHAEIAMALGINERTVRRWLMRALALLDGDREPSRSLRPIVPVHVAAISSGDFLLQRMIGAGASGKIYRAINSQHGNYLAIKFLRKALQVDARSVARFINECDLLAELEHPHIMPILGFGRTPAGGCFFAMPLADGDLQMFVERRAPYEQIVAWLRQAAAGLYHAHNRGVLHCDLKPSNLLLFNGLVCVSDFGLAQPMVRGRGGLLLGTPAYMAPEQVSPQFGPLTPATDVYGLGVTAYALLTGSPPFGDRGAGAVLERIVSHEAVRPVSLTRADVPAWLDDLCIRCLARRPGDRPVSIEDFLAAIPPAL